MADGTADLEKTRAQLEALLRARDAQQLMGFGRHEKLTYADVYRCDQEYLSSIASMDIWWTHMDTYVAMQRFQTWARDILALDNALPRAVPWPGGTKDDETRLHHAKARADQARRAEQVRLNAERQRQTKELRMSTANAHLLDMPIELLNEVVKQLRLLSYLRLSSSHRKMADGLRPTRVEYLANIVYKDDQRPNLNKDVKVKAMFKREKTAAANLVRIPKGVRITSKAQFISVGTLVAEGAMPQELKQLGDEINSLIADFRNKCSNLKASAYKAAFGSVSSERLMLGLTKVKEARKQCDCAISRLRELRAKYNLNLCMPAHDFTTWASANEWNDFAKLISTPVKKDMCL